MPSQDDPGPTDGPWTARVELLNGPHTGVAASISQVTLLSLHPQHGHRPPKFETVT